MVLEGLQVRGLRGWYGDSPQESGFSFSLQVSDWLDRKVETDRRVKFHIRGWMV